MSEPFSARALADEIRPIVTRGSSRKYYRIPRRGQWYGGIATADCSGCNLRCVFCWSDKPREHPERIGTFHSPEQVFGKLSDCAAKNGYELVRLSGNEPTLAKDHLLEVLEFVEESPYTFILETNGTLIDDEYAKDLSRFRRLHVRVSFKGTTPEEFSSLTGAEPEDFWLQMGALVSLVKARVSVNPAVNLSFSPERHIRTFKETIAKVHPRLLDLFEEEYIFLYPHVKRRLKDVGIRPLVAYSPKGEPENLI